MAAQGISTVRIPHTTPPARCSTSPPDMAHGVMVGLSEQFAGYLIDRDKAAHDVEGIVQDKVHLCKVTRPYCATRSATRFRRRSRVGSARGGSPLTSSGCTRLVRQTDPEGLVTYVNYRIPQLPFLDLVCFNVYLEQRPAFAALPRAAAERRRRPALAD
jgi:hypothetical protein